MNQESRVKSVEIKDDKATILLEVDVKELLKLDSIFGWSERGNMQAMVAGAIAKEVLKAIPIADIRDQVLKDVNWPDIVRSEIAQKVIKEIASGNRTY